MMQILDQRALDAMDCGTPNCGHDHSVLWMHARCHPRSNLAVAYQKATGTILVTCAKCNRTVGEIAVAAQCSPAS